MSEDIHRLIKERPKTKWFKSLKEALDANGVPAGSWAAHAELKDLLEKADGKQYAERVAERGEDAAKFQQNPYITDLGKDCARQLFFAYAHVEKTDHPDEYSFLKFRIGNLVEEAYTNLYAEAGYEIEREQRVELEKDGVLISGRIDFLRTGDKPIELKATEQDKFKWTIAERAPGKPDHRSQGNGYLFYKNVVMKENVPALELRYVIYDAPKGTPAVLSFDVKHDPEKATRDLDRLVRIWNMAQAGIDPGLPPLVLEKKDLVNFPCLWCSYRSICKEDLAKMKRGAA